MVILEKIFRSVFLLITVCKHYTITETRFPYSFTLRLGLIQFSASERYIVIFVKIYYMFAIKNLRYAVKERSKICAVL